VVIKEQDSNYYAFWCRFNEKPCIILGCPGLSGGYIIQYTYHLAITCSS